MLANSFLSGFTFESVEVHASMIQTHNVNEHVGFDADADAVLKLIPRPAALQRSSVWLDAPQMVVDLYWLGSRPHHQPAAALPEGPPLKAPSPLNRKAR